MKKQIILIITIIATISCKSQTVTLDMATYGTNDFNNSGEYLKDFDNNLDKFIGAWKWEEGNSSFIIEFEKREMVSYQPYFNYYADIIIGKYKYVENGIEIVNNLNQSFDYIFYPIKTSFNQSNLNNLYISFIDYTKDKSGKGHIELDTTTNPPQFLWSVGGNSKVLIDGETSIEGWSLPIGSYNQKILIKQ